MRAVTRVGTLAACAALLVAVPACRKELGPADYSSHEGLALDGGPRPEPLPGTDPYLPGEHRLSLGLFYEGEVSQRYPLDPERLCLRVPHAEPLRCYFIFTTEDTGELQYEQDTVADRVEGTLSDRFTLTGTPFWGGGILWDQPTDLAAWSTLAVALKSSDPAFARVTITLQSDGGEARSASVEATDYGYANDGEWHALRIPLADFAGADLSAVTAPLLLGGPGNTAGARLLVDEVYLTRD